LIQSRARRTGITSLCLLAATVTATVVLARGYHLGVAAALVGLVGGIPGLYLMWAAYRDDRAESQATAASMGLVEVADELAVAVRAQWAAEASIRRLNDPVLLVRWVPADSYLAEDWLSLVTLATSGAGWPVPLAAVNWAGDAAALAGAGSEIADVLGRIPTRRLMVLGEPGAGKTMLLVRLVLDLLTRRQPGEPVPMLVSLASWSPASQDLRKWLAAQMTDDYPVLGAPAPEGSLKNNRAEALLERGLILPILDGLDEIPEALRGAAVAEINAALRPGEAVVVSSRIDAYKSAVRPSRGASVTLRGGAVVELCPVDAITAGRYLVHDAGDPHRWDPVVAVLGTSSPAGKALATPLMLSLAREIYNPLPDAGSDALREPVELCSPAITSRELVEQHLLDAFVPTAYRRSSAGPGRQRRFWTAKQAERWLVFLAYHLEHTVASPSFAWWNLERAVPRTVNTVASSITVALGLGLTLAVTSSSTVNIPARLMAGLAAASIAGLAVWLAGRRPQIPMIGAGWSLRWAVRRVIWLQPRSTRPSGIYMTLAIIAFPVGIVLTWLVFGLAVAPVWMLVGFTALGVRGRYDELAEVATPQTSLARDRRNLLLLAPAALAYGTTFGVVLGTAGGRAVRTLFGAAYGPTLGTTAGLVVSIAFTLGCCSVTLAWLRWRIACASLAICRRLPWRMSSFLDDAHQRGVLRQAGAVYQFRHLELQRRLAAAAKNDIRSSD
jgi:hypothetical protein